MLASSARGVGLVEVLIALALVSGVVVMALSAISTGTKSVGTYDRISTAQNIAQAQLEYTKSAAYESLPASYDAIPLPPANYSVTVKAYAVTGDGEGVPRDEMQKIVVTVYHQGNAVFSKEGYKVDR
ncbi:hypothetical protein ACFLXN_02310 [Chloroflexota bacterium]